jgi:Arc/MetJ-type ribon-helix-helix transcriptional regulator
MPQLNIHLTPSFQNDLAEYMQRRRLRTKSEAVRQAVAEAVERERSRHRPTDFSRWLGLATGVPQNPHPRFPSDDNLWE